MPKSRQAILDAFLEAYDHYSQAAFGGERKAAGSLFLLLANFQGERDWDFPEAFSSLRQRFTSAVAVDPDLRIAVVEMNERPETVDVQLLRKWLREHEQESPFSKKASNLAEAASEGFDKFHSWLFKHDPELGHHVRSLLLPPWSTVSAAGSFLVVAVAIAPALVPSAPPQRPHAPAQSGAAGSTSSSPRPDASATSPAGSLPSQPTLDADRTLPPVPESPGAIQSPLIGNATLAHNESSGLACGTLEGPEKKACLIVAADGLRASVDPSRDLYEAALRVPHGAGRETRMGKRTLLWYFREDGVGYSQDYVALEALASLFATHGRPAEATSYMKRAIELAKTPESLGFGPGVTNGQLYVSRLLARLAHDDDLVSLRSVGYPDNATGALEIDDALLSSLDLSASARIKKLMAGLTAVEAPWNQKGGYQAMWENTYWEHLVPARDEVIRRAREGLAAMLDEIPADHRAEDNGIVFWIEEEKEGASAHLTATIVDIPWSPGCRLLEGPWNPRWEWVIRVDGRVVPPLAVRQRVAEFPMPRAHARVTVNVVIQGTATSRTCLSKTASATYCSNKGGPALGALCAGIDGH